jgi:hypothetical protein
MHIISSRKLMKTKFVFTVTVKSDYTLKYKARLVVCGYSQIKGIDCVPTVVLSWLGLTQSECVRCDCCIPRRGS